MTRSTGNYELLFGRRGQAMFDGPIHAVRNNAFDRPIAARCGVRVARTVGQDQPVSCELCTTLLNGDRRIANAPFAEQISRLEAAIGEAGFTLLYVDACEDINNPGLIGMGVGVTNWRRREVRLRNMLTGAVLVHELEHELAHVEECSGFERGTHTICSQEDR